MPSAHAVVNRLRDEDWIPFHSYLFARRTTISKAHAWLAARGYQVSRAAVGNYSLHCRRTRLRNARARLGGGDDELRGEIHRRASRLAGPELVKLAIYATYLASGAAAESKSGTARSSPASPGDRPTPVRT